MSKIFIIILIINQMLSANVAFVKKIEGDSSLKREKRIFMVTVGMKLMEGDIIFTKEKSSVDIEFISGKEISLGEKVIYIIKKKSSKFEKKREYDVKFYREM